ncbi:ligand-binding sensor domain-containing protein [Niabella insulamsoli]|uniref:ligand-binding sensor domain-containing protein n=1 Tax=Niabella insulamsoli TaxID=3144874 RepID=UPI0031FCDE74
MQRFIIFILLLVSGLPSKAQQYHFRHYQVEDGLSNNTSICTLQDSKGFLWFGTKDGLNRFDGYTFKVFRHNPADPSSIGNNSIWRLYEDEEGMIWVGTERGLYQYNPSSEKFTLLDRNLRNEISGITTDKNGRLWFLAGFKLYSYSKQEAKLVKYDQLPLLHFCTALNRTENGEIWIGTIDGNILRYNETYKTFSSFSVFMHSSPSSSSWIEKIYDSGQGFLFIGTSNQGVKKFDLNTHAYTDLLTYNEDKTDIYARDFIRRNRDEYWIATEKGIYIYDSKKNQFNHLVKNPLNPYALSDNAVYAFAKDKEGGIWACTYFGGINYYPKHKIEFEKFFYTPGEHTLKGNAVREITQDKYHTIWIGTEDAGLHAFDTKTLRFVNYHPKDGHSKLAHTNIHGLMADDDQLWIGTFEHGLDIMDIKKRQVIKHYAYGTGAFDLKSNFIHSIYKTNAGKIFVGTSNGLYLYSRSNDHFIPLQFLPPNTFFSALTEDQRGNLWIGTFKNGVYFYNPDRAVYGHLKINLAGSDRLSENRVTNLYVDSKQQLLVSTEDGLFKINLASLSAKIYTTATGLPGNHIYSAIEDREHFLWVTTSKGLVRLNPTKQTPNIYTQSSGLLSDQFNYASGFRDADNFLYFGSAKGLIRFNPIEPAKASSKAPPLYITNFQINNKDVEIDEDGPLTSSILKMEQLILKYTQSSISLDFAALNFSSPQTIKYAYKLEGLDEDWNYLKSNRRIYFTNLSPGNYQFVVKSTDNNGNWSPNEKALSIKILPPWWLSRWAYLSYALLAILVIYMAIIFYHNRQLDKQQRRMEAFERSKEKEMYESKIDFFTHIAHEIKTPLTLIKAPMEKLIKQLVLSKQHEKYLLVMNKNTDRLIDLTHQLLDFRRVEAGAFTINLEKKDVNALVKAIWANFQPLAESKNVRLILKEAQVFFCRIDEEATIKIINNLLDNAIKYGQSLIITSLTHDEDGFVKITISSNGPLIADEMKEKIFQPFFRSRQTNKITGTGIGLPLARSLAELQGGSLYVAVDDNLNNFILKLPIDTKYDG